MFSWLTKLFAKSQNNINIKPITALQSSNAPRSQGFQLAILSDTQFIFESILAEAANGHFNADYQLPETHAGLNHQICSSITSGKNPARHNVISQSAIYIFLDNDCPIGFSWVVETDVKGERELYLLVVSPSHRSKGIGKHLVSKTISHFPPKTKFIARLYSKSMLMSQMLIKMGFTEGKIQRAKHTKRLSFISG